MTLTNLDNEIFAQAALEGFSAALLPFASFSTNFSADAVAKGDTVLVPLIGALTATTFGGSYAVSGGTASAITISINRHKHVPISNTDLTAASSSVANLEKFAFQQGQALGLAVVQDVFSLLTTANFGLATAVSVVDFGLAQIRRGRYLLNDANVPITPRSLILDLDPYDNLLGISNFIQAQLKGDSEGLSEGRAGRIFGMPAYQTHALPGTNSIMGFAAHSSAIAIAMRYLMPIKPEAYAEAGPVADPTTGAVFGLRKHYDANTGTEYTNLEANYGFAVGISNGARLFRRND